MTRDQASPDSTAAERDRTREDTGDRQRADIESATEPARGVGITDEDMAQIRSFLEKQRYSRTVDDLRPLSESSSGD